MKVVLLCAGYGTRLEKDLRSDPTGRFQHLIGLPKPLLPIGNRPLLSLWIDILGQIEEPITKIVVVVNESHRKRFEEWKAETPSDVPVILLSDGSVTNETRSGAVKCMYIGSQVGGLEDTIFVAGDTLFPKDFNLQSVLRDFSLKKEINSQCSIIVGIPVDDEHVSKHGIIEIEESTNRVTNFLEKPDASQTTSRLHSPCFYVISSACLPFIEEFLQEKKDMPLSCRDATGHAIAHLIRRSDVFAHMMTKRYDIGNLKSYLMCLEELQA